MNITWIKENWFKIGLIAVLVIFIASAFYWFEYRPTKIRHDCSWFKMTSPATPAEPAITKEDVAASQIKYDECIKKYDVKPSGNIFFDALNNKAQCNGLLKQERQAALAKSETYWHREAGKAEYDFCIHEKGL